MTQKEYKLVRVVAVIALVAYIGLVAIQLNWVNESIKQRKYSFDQLVYNSLDKALARFEEKSMQEFFDKNSINFNKLTPQEYIEKIQDQKGNLSLRFKLEDSSSEIIKTLSTEINVPKNVIESMSENEFNRILNQYFSLSKNWKNQAKLLVYQGIDVSNKINEVKLNQEIKEELVNHGVNTAFQIAIFDANSKNVIFSNIKDLNSETLEDSYKSKIFPESLFNNYAVLIIHFPDKEKEIFRSLQRLLLISVILLLVITISFYYTLHTIIKQKKLNEMKTDFINNMTHELKTPVTSIALAVNMIKNDKIISQPDKVKKYTEIIRFENLRLLQNIEKVLQSAKFNKSEIRLKLNKENILELITNIVENENLILKEKNAHISIINELDNQEYFVDTIHFTNVIANLLENANKYRKEDDLPLEIKIILSHYENQNLSIRILDNGIGIKSEYTDKIFNKFYRVPTGNLHNVKGFGLGLNYVKVIIEAHKGKVFAKSTFGEGTEIIIHIPKLVYEE
jgi:two-component system phosphate regulon sensor histidine kinase PhoR